MNERHRREDLPDRNAEYLIYQTLVGAWPIDVERVLAYMEKASREAKAYTSWTKPNEAYDSALRAFIEKSMDSGEFTSDLEQFVAPLVGPGRINSLSQTLIKLTAPGIPDFYQGTELWDLSLVDPDNRRPVDYKLRRELLTQLDDAKPEEIWKRIDEGLPKLWIIRQVLKLRRERGLCAVAEDYRPLNGRGARADHLVAYARGGRAVVLAPRLPMKLGGSWGDTRVELPDGKWLDHFSRRSSRGGEVRLADLLDPFPVAFMSAE